MVQRVQRHIQNAVLINPYTPYAKGTNAATLYPPIGLLYIASTLEKLGVTCTVIDAGVLHYDHRMIRQLVTKARPDMIGITTNIVTARASVDLGGYLRKTFPKTLIVYGGPYATAVSEYILKKTKGDIVVYGEGEATVGDLLSHVHQLNKVKGIYYRKGNTIVRNPSRELITDLDSIPFPAYHLLPAFSLYKSRSRATPIGWIFTSRGCPYNCIYCNKNIFGKTFRVRSPANVLTEIELLVGRYKVRQIDVLDDNFTLIPKRAEEIFDQIIKRNIRVLFNFQNGLRADRLTPRLVRKMKLAGTYKAGIGIESGDPAIQKIIKKSLSLPKVTRAVRMLRKAGIVVSGFFMIGIPGETEASIQKTIDFAVRVNPHVAVFSAVVPLPQTELYDMIDTHGKFLRSLGKGTDAGFFSDRTGFEIGQVNEALIRASISKAYRQFYLRPSKIIDTLLSVRSLSELRWLADSAFPLIQYLCR